MSSPSSPVESCSTSNQLNKKNNERNIKKNKGKLLTDSQPTTLPSKSVEIPTKTTRKPKFPYRICKRDHLLNDFLDIS